MNLLRWEPFQELEEMFRQYSALPSLRRRAEGSTWAPVADISESDQEYLIKAELPEVQKQDVKITLEDGVITISGERKQEKELKQQNEIRVESFYGAFSRSFSLPENIDAEHISAESKDGVLKVRIPKTQSLKARPVTIAVK